MVSVDLCGCLRFVGLAISLPCRLALSRCLSPCRVVLPVALRCRLVLSPCGVALRCRLGLSGSWAVRVLVCGGLASAVGVCLWLASFVGLAFAVVSVVWSRLPVHHGWAVGRLWDLLARALPPARCPPVPALVSSAPWRCCSRSFVWCWTWSSGVPCLVLGRRSSSICLRRRRLTLPAAVSGGCQRRLWAAAVGGGCGRRLWAAAVGGGCCSFSVVGGGAAVCSPLLAAAVVAGPLVGCLRRRSWARCRVADARGLGRLRSERIGVRAAAGRWLECAGQAASDRAGWLGRRRERRGWRGESAHVSRPGRRLALRAVVMSAGNRVAAQETRRPGRRCCRWRAPAVLANVAVAATVAANIQPWCRRAEGRPKADNRRRR